MGSRCLGNHPRKNCRSNKRRWVEYVLDLMEHYQDIPDWPDGKWLKVINEEFGEIITEPNENTNQDCEVEEIGEARTMRGSKEPQVSPEVQPVTQD